MRILVLGAGAVGGFLAGGFHENGHAVSVLARGTHLAAIKAHGLRVRHADGREICCNVTATDDPRELGDQDLIVTTVKAPALAGVLAACEPLLRRGMPVVTAMNGVFWWYGTGFAGAGQPPDCARLDPDGTLARLVPADQAVGMVIHSTNQVVEPGLIQNRSARNRFVIGAATRAGADRIEAMLPSLQGPGTRFEFERDLRRTMWHKLLRNLSSAPASVLTGGMAYQVLNDPDAQPVARALFLEGAAVARAHGFDGLGDDVARVFAPGAGAHQKPSMSQDVDLGRPMEIDTMLRIVQDFGRQTGVPTPTLDVVIGLVILRARLAGGYPPAGGADP
ncbi:2-dehydropantoate 2-reductase [Roseobacter sp. YSTF-M11]|uniref:2-dehydropantoate 2-reductase n=1 Tax=Roseobacter insulae TaxID=2859783 RepID=A0A9X1K4I0_9RHOB|nr:2-dehydropantoate 2-reductase [Roseobacter insulae]MBW4709737.1 2-dehydropantoate 2-reductase [Roseobacter insulae]